MGCEPKLTFERCNIHNRANPNILKIRDSTHNGEVRLLIGAFRTSSIDCDLGYVGETLL